jgi:hypothetical protein
MRLIFKPSILPLRRLTMNLFFGLLVVPLVALGQTTISTGSIQGTVTDPSGAVVRRTPVFRQSRFPSWSK